MAENDTVKYNDVFAIVELVLTLQNNAIISVDLDNPVKLDEDDIDTILASNNVEDNLDDFMEFVGGFLPDALKLNNENGYWLS